MIVTAEEFQRRVIEPESFVADKRAFVDVRLARSKGKESYSFIGPGVSQNADQTINLSEPHGFNVGAASLPGGVVNNPHLHFTAEVFICTSGAFRFTVGLGDRASAIDVGPGDVLSVPTWVFRSFENIGGDQGWVFTALGRDQTGGVVWAPGILEEAAETGLFLAADDSLIDTNDGDTLDGVELVAPMTADEVEALPVVTPEALASRLVGLDQLTWSDRALLSAATGSAIEVAPVIGRGMSQDRLADPVMTDSHGFSLEWLRLAPGAESGRHRVDASQVLYLIEGSWTIEMNDPALDRAEPVTADPVVGSIVSLPADSVRNLRNTGAEPALAVVVTEGDDRPRLTWDSDVTGAAATNNIVVDANGYLAPANIVHRRAAG